MSMTGASRARPGDWPCIPYVRAGSPGPRAGVARTRTVTVTGVTGTPCERRTRMPVGAVTPGETLGTP